MKSVTLNGKLNKVVPIKVYCVNIILSSRNRKPITYGSKRLINFIIIQFTYYYL